MYTYMWDVSARVRSNANINGKRFIVVINLSFDLVRTSFCESRHTNTHKHIQRSASAKRDLNAACYVRMLIFLCAFFVRCFSLSLLIRLCLKNLYIYVWRIVYLLGVWRFQCCRRCCRCRRRSSFSYSFITLLISSFLSILIHNWRDKRFNYAFRSVSFFLFCVKDDKKRETICFASFLNRGKRMSKHKHINIIQYWPFELGCLCFFSFILRSLSFTIFAISLFISSHHLMWQFAIFFFISCAIAHKLIHKMSEIIVKWFFDFIKRPKTDA